MRLVYMDEAGISRDEPITVVAGAIIHGDDQLNAVEKHLIGLVEKHIPEHQRHGFVFHATHLFNGVKGDTSLFGRDNPEWPLSRRLEVAADLAAIPMLYDIPVAMGVSHRKNLNRVLEDYVTTPEWKKTAALHMTAFISCSLNIERWMRQWAGDENCLLLVENNESHRNSLKRIQQDMQDKNKQRTITDEWEYYFPFQRIREDPLFQEKKPYSPLQIADFLAYVLKRRLMEDAHYFPYVESFWQQVIIDRSFLEPPPSTTPPSELSDGKHQVS